LQPLDLYAYIEEYLDFDEEVRALYTKIASQVLEKELKSIIDIGCGQGEFCRLLEANGVKTFGVDLSAKQVEIAAQKGLDAECIDIKDVTNKYEGATAVFDVINYIGEKDLNSFFKSTYNLLESGGYFIIDVNSLYGFSEVAQGTLNIDTEDKFIAIDANFEEDTLYTGITLFEKKNKCFHKTKGTIEQFYHKKEKLKKLLAKTGFEKIEIVSFNLHGFDEDDKWIFICKKEK
jgi:SAM-dependent methyltransferase